MVNISDFNEQHKIFLMQLIGNQELNDNGNYKNGYIIEAFNNEFGNIVRKEILQKYIVYVRKQKFPHKLLAKKLAKAKINDEKNKMQFAITKPLNSELDEANKILLIISKLNEIKELAKLSEVDYKQIKTTILSNL